MKKKEKNTLFDIAVNIVSILIAWGIVAGICTVAHCDENITTLITKEAQRQNFDADVALSIAIIESQLNPNAIGPKKEVGLFQILPRYSPVPVKSLMNPKINARIGIMKLIDARDHCPVHEELTYVICFNQGNSKRPKHPKLHPYYKRFIAVWAQL